MGNAVQYEAVDPKEHYILTLRGDEFELEIHASSRGTGSLQDIMEEGGVNDPQGSEVDIITRYFGKIHSKEEGKVTDKVPTTINKVTHEEQGEMVEGEARVEVSIFSYSFFFLIPLFRLTITVKLLLIKI